MTDTPMMPTPKAGPPQHPDKPKTPVKSMTVTRIGILYTIRIVNNSLEHHPGDVLTEDWIRYLLAVGWDVQIVGLNISIPILPIQVS